jgi:outer membrane lipoprotein-sorting protein
LLGGLFIVVLFSPACAPPLMKLPSGPSTAAADGRDAVADATAACRRVTSMTAEMAVSGSVGGQRLRGHMLVGVQQPSSARLEAAAPFGAPLFIFVARGNDATLLLPRDDRVLEHGRPDVVLDAVAGVPLEPADLRTVLTGCAIAPDAEAARQPGPDWRIVPDGPGHLYLHRDGPGGPWRLAATVRQPEHGEGWRAEYRSFRDGLPQEIRLTSLTPARFDLRLALTQVETNVALGPEAFQVQVPRSAQPMTLAELRASGPLSRPPR